MKTAAHLIILLMCKTVECKSQDTLVTHVSEVGSNSSAIIYGMSVRNISSEPICILHSVFIDLNAMVPQSIVPYSGNKTDEFFGLSYSAKDTTMVLERTLYDGEVLMPNQIINFNLSIPKTGKTKTLYFEFIRFSDFCYKKLKDEMNKAATWYSSYTRLKVVVKLPD